MPQLYSRLARTALSRAEDDRPFVFQASRRQRQLSFHLGDVLNRDGQRLCTVESALERPSLFGQRDASVHDHVVVDVVGRCDASLRLADEL
jgi:hypothetical protein